MGTIITTIQKRGTITIPRAMREELDLSPGDPLAVIVEDGAMIMTPVAVVPRTLRLTPKGEKKMREAGEDSRQGRVKRFDTAEELLKDIEGDRNE